MAQPSFKSCERAVQHQKNQWLLYLQGSTHSNLSRRTHFTLEINSVVNESSIQNQCWRGPQVQAPTVTDNNAKEFFSPEGSPQTTKYVPTPCNKPTTYGAKDQKPHRLPCGTGRGKESSSSPPPPLALTKAMPLGEEFFFYLSLVEPF